MHTLLLSAHGSADHRTLVVPADVREAAVAPCEALRSLEVSGGGQLEVLDLSALPGDLMLYTRQLPRLRRLVLPTGSGCHLHLALDGPPSLHVDGDVAWIDACWPGASGERTLSASWNEHARALRPPVLRGAWLGTSAEMPGGVELLALCGDTSAKLDVSTHGAVCVVIEDAAQLEALTVGSPHMLAVMKAPALRTLAVVQAGAVCVDDALGLEAVQGNGTQLSLRDSARVETLEVDGRWHQVFIHREGPRRLVAPGTQRLDTELVRRLEHRACAVGVEATKGRSTSSSSEARLQMVVQDLLTGTELSAATKASTVSSAQRLGPQRVLEALAALAAPGGSARLVDIWTLRMAVARCQRKKDGKKGLAWSWEFPQDLADRGWRADLRLWSACRSEAASARDFEAVIRASADPEHLAAVADAASGQHTSAPAGGSREASVPWLEILADQLRAGVEQGRYLPIPPSTRTRAMRVMTKEAREQLAAAASPQIIQALQMVLRALVRLREHAAVPGLVDLLCEWIVRRIPNSSGVKVLAALHALGARRAIAALSAVVALPGTRPEVRHEALMASLTAPQQQLLAFPEDRPHAPEPIPTR